jgi:hypothetical protein
VSEGPLTLSCRNCGEPIGLRISKVAKQHASIQDVNNALAEWIDQVDVSESDGSIMIRPKGYLGKELWFEMNNALKSLGAEWVSAGKESKWIIRK